MGKNDEVYIGSISPTISVSEQRALRVMTHQMGGSLTFDEFKKIMLVYNDAIDRILKENGVDENDT